MPDSTRRIGNWLSAYVALTLVLTSLWTQFDAIGWGMLLLFALTLALDWRPGLFVPAEPARVPEAAGPLDVMHSRWLPSGLTAQSMAIGIAICVPVFLHLVLTRNEEFPFAGDEGYEFSASRSYALLLKQALPFLIVWAVLVFGVFRRLSTPLPRLTMFLGGLFVLSYWFPPHPVVARYPAGFYFLAMPLNVLATAAGWQSPFQANHIVNALSVPAWLFVLRPAILRRWPDWTILPLGVFLFYQKEVVYVFAGGAAIEPWALVFLLLAFEALLVLPPESAWLACLLAGWSFMFKEPGIVLFPVVWLLAMRGMRVSGAIRHAAYGLAVIAPFAVYYVVRRLASIHRTVSFGQTEPVFTAARVDTWLHRVAGQFGATGLVLAAIIVLYSVGGLWWLRRDRPLLRVHTALVVAACGLLVFNFSEDLTLPWIAYSRYMLYPIFLAGLLLVPLATILERAGQRRVILAGSLIMFACHALPTAGLIALDLRPDYARNSLEWAHIPMFYPVRALAQQMLARPDARGVRDLRVLTVGVDPIVAPVAYPDLNRRMAIHPELMHSAEQCACRNEHEATFIGLQYRTGLALDEAEDQSLPLLTQACVAQLRTTCATVLEAFHDTGAPVGLLGVPGVSHGGHFGSGQ